MLTSSSELYFMRVIQYFTYRLGSIFFMVIIVQMLTITMVSIIPGGYCSFVLPDHASVETRQACEQQQPSLWRKYEVAFVDLFQLDLGRSLRGSHRPISTELAEHIPATFYLALISGTLSLSLGIVGGVLAAKGRYKLWGQAINWLGIGLLVLPVFILAFLLRYVLVFNLKWFHILEDPDQWQSLIMPTLAISLPLGAWFMRITRNAIVNELNRDYIRMAQAKGLLNQYILIRHALRNALSAIIPLAGLTLIGLLDGVLLIEIIFNRPGLGRYTFDAVLTQDYPALQGVVLLITIVTVTGNLATDLVYAWLFPQNRYEILKREMAVMR